MISYGTPSIEVRAIKPVSKIKIGWIAPNNWQAAQTRIRVLHVNKCLRSMGYLSNVTESYQEIIDKKYDIAIIGKTFDETSYNNIKFLKQHGITVLCDICESIFQFPYVIDIVKISNKVICCSYALEEQVKKFNENTVVIEDAYETY